MDSPKISVIMGIYNTKSFEYLKKSIESILNQSYRDFEFIICDDGSTNDCFKWAQEICKNDSRVVLIQNSKNMGLAYTLNRCLEISKGNYIARMDDDDESMLNRFERQLDYLETNKDVDLVSCNINLFDENGIYNEMIFPEKINNKDFLFNSPLVHPAIIAKKEIFEKVNRYCEDKQTVRVEDYDMFMKMKSQGAKMNVIQDKLFNYRMDRDNIVRRKKYKYRINELIVRYKGFKLLKLYPKGFIYVFKPLIIGLMPKKMILFIKTRRKTYEKK